MNEVIDRKARIYVAGHSGLLGSALVRQLEGQGYRNLILRSHAELDLTDATKVRGFFAEQRPEIVFLLAAKVGGILANDTHPAEFIYENLSIQNHVIHQSYVNGVRRLIFLGSSCIYPRDCPQPIKEEYLLTGPLELTNRPYAIAKIAGIELCWSYNRQYGTKFLAAMPTNLFGQNDNYDPTSSHVIPALIRKVNESKKSNQDEVLVWGTGRPRREFLYSDDAASGCIFLMQLSDEDFLSLTAPATGPPLINVGTGRDLTIQQLAQMICDVIGFKGKIAFDHSKPDGTPRKLLEVSKLERLGWKPTVSLQDGIERTYRDFLGQQDLHRIIDKPLQVSGR
jgi:GDP-L-fucose synthase